MCVLTASIRDDSSPADTVDAHLFLQPDQLVDDSLGGGTDVKRAMSMLRMGRDDQAMKKAMGMLRMGRAPAADRRAMGMLRMGRPFTDNADEQNSKRAMSMLRMGRAMGMLRMGRPSDVETVPVASQNDKRGMPMLRMG